MTFAPGSENTTFPDLEVDVILALPAKVNEGISN
jgi:hypothetical protein